MANTKSARKRVRQNERDRQRNRAARTNLRSQVKKVRTALGAGDLEAAEQLLRAASSTIDRSAKKGVIHVATAARSKSRLAKAKHRLEAAASAAAGESPS